MSYPRSLVNILLIAALCLLIPLLFIIAPAYTNPLIAFFFDADALPTDENGDGGHDYIYIKFDVDLDEDVTTNVTVIAELYNQSGKIVATKSVTYKVTGQEVGYNSLKLTPSPNVSGIYNARVMLSDKSDELYVNNIYYNPVPGSKPIAYFADAVVSSTLNMVILRFDVNMVQEINSNVTVNATLIDSTGKTINSQNLTYKTFFDSIDYQRMNFIPTFDDAYSIVLTVYPEGGLAADSRILNVLWPPGIGAYFRKYEAFAFNDRIELAFDVDLEYNITYMVTVEAILYNSQSDVAAYGYTSYLTTGTLSDENRIALFPKASSHDKYYAELIVNVDGYPASYGYIEDIPFGRPRWYINGDNVVDILDLIIVAREFGKKSFELLEPKADVNLDGIVDILDLVIVAHHFGEKW